MHIARIGLAIAAALLAAGPAMAQQARTAAEIVLVPGPAQSGYRVLGDVRAEIHQKSIMAKTPARELADRELKAQAARLGADAVVDIKYETNSPMFSKKGFIAVGKAVKFEAMVAAAPVAAPPVAVPQAPAATLPLQTAEAAAPAPVAPAPAPAVVRPTTQPAPAQSPVAAAASPPGPLVSAPGPRMPTAQALIVLTEDNLAGRAVTVLGLVEAEAHQTSLFPKKTARDMLEEDLRAKAAALGADAVISIKYDMNSPMLSKKGSRATGVAVKLQ